MITIVEPKKHIASLWGKQKVTECKHFRLMHYVLRVEYEGKMLLHNVVTGELVLLDDEESLILERLPKIYSPLMKQLVEAHYLVPEDYDEYQQVLKLRRILLRLEANHPPDSIVGYTILPTTTCNARCYYCFEQGSVKTTMTEQTANDVVDFIVEHADERKKVFITWFGGEPTVAENRIDQISDGLNQKGISFISKMITNGYLLDDAMVHKAKNAWHVFGVQICVDGTENSYNSAKAYVAARESPYQKVMHNIGVLLENGITVGLRMNFDVGNYTEFEDLIEEAKRRFGDSDKLIISAHPVIGEYRDWNGNLAHGSDAWFSDKLAELSNYARNQGVCKRLIRLPYLNCEICSACNDATITIRPDGGLVRCPEKFENDQVIGTVRTGIVDQELVDSWKEIADFPQCHGCVLFPNCIRLENCSNTTYCHKWKDYLLQCEELVKKYLISFYKNDLKGVLKHGISGT